MTKQFSNYSDLLTFTRASKGHALRPVSYGTELVTNGTFDTDTTGWTAGNNAVLSVSSNRLRVGLNVTDFAYASQSFATQAGKIYLITFNSWGSNQPALWRLGTSLTSNNVYQSVGKSDDNFSWYLAFVAQSDTTFLTLYANSTSDTGYAEYDNVSVKEVTFDEPDGTLTLFEHPNNVPRVEWDADRNRLGLLVEESRTNLIIYSESFNNSAVFKVNTTITADQKAAPNGTTSADLVTFTENTNSFFGDNLPITGGQTYTFSIWLSGVAGQTLRIYLDTGGGTYQFSGKDVTLTESFERHSVTLTTVATNTTVNAVVNSRLHTGQDDAVSIYAWGAQVEEGSFPTSYIKSNSGSTTTRSADVASIPVSDFGFNASEGSVVCEVQHFTTENSSAHAAFAFDDGTSSNRMWYYQNKGQWIGSVSGTTTFSLGVIYPDENALTKVGVTYKKDDYVIYINGDNEGSDTSSNVPVVDTFYIGNTFDSTTRLNGHIKSIKYYPRRLSNAQLVELTS